MPGAPRPARRARARQREDQRHAWVECPFLSQKVAVSGAPAAIQRRIVSMAEAGSGPPTSGIGTPWPAARVPSSFKRRKLSAGSFGRTRCRFAALAASLVASTPTRFAYAAPSLRSRPPDAAPVPWQKAVAQVLSKIFFWMSLANVAPLGGFGPFGRWHTKAKRWPPCAASTFMTTCPFFFPLVGTATVAAAVQSVPGVALVLNFSKRFGS